MIIKVAAFPFDVRPAQVELNLQQVLNAVRDCGKARVQLLELPEKWTTSFLAEYSAEIRAESEEA